jgi:hypothetical protein
MAAGRCARRKAEARGPGRLFLDGTVTEIGRDYFLFDGVVRITDNARQGANMREA